jgi:hypothetical protein
MARGVSQPERAGAGLIMMKTTAHTRIETLSKRQLYSHNPARPIPTPITDPTQGHPAQNPTHSTLRGVGGWGADSMTTTMTTTMTYTYTHTPHTSRHSPCNPTRCNSTHNSTPTPTRITNPTQGHLTNTITDKQRPTPTTHTRQYKHAPNLTQHAPISGKRRSTSSRNSGSYTMAATKPAGRLSGPSTNAAILSCS